MGQGALDATISYIHTEANSPSFTANPENGFAYYKTAPGCPAPSHGMIKEFIRWHIGSITGRLDEDERPTMRTISAGAECFFGGFEELTKVKIIEADRKEIKTVSPHLNSLFSITNPI